MDKHSKRSASIFRYPVLIAFTLFFAGLFLLDLVTPDRAYSELENTTLSQRPSLSSFSADGLNKFFTAYTKYVKDQVAGRDNWVALQSTVETKVMQKEQSGGILLGKEHMMFPRTYGLVSSETRTLPKNTAALEALCRRYPGLVNVMLVPAASAVYPENVPAGAPLLDEDRYLDALSEAVQAAGGRFVDVRQTLADHKGEYIYYRTDHHWTGLGAYYAYVQFCAAKGITPHSLSEYEVSQYDGFLGSFYNDGGKPDAMKNHPDTVTAYHPISTEARMQYGKTADSLTPGKVIYDESDAAAGLKYGTFIMGDNPYTVIENPDLSDGSKCIVVKESFGNAFVPFLVDHYQTVYVIDYRYYSGSVSALAKANGVTDVIFANNLSAIRGSYQVGKLAGVK